MADAAARAWLVFAISLTLGASVARAQAPAPQGAALSQADDQEARELFGLGKQAFDEGRFERALKYFNDAYELSHRAGLLSNIGTVLDRLRRDQEALDAYQRYLAQVPDAPNRALIEERIRIIQAAMQKPGAQPQSAQPQAIAPTPAATAQAQMASPQAPASATQAEPQAQARSSGGLLTRWWFWTGVGALAATAVVIGIAASSSGGTSTPPPAVIGAATRIREL
jgi:tetratricopeptide (TPR) repeat protein